MSIRNKLWRFIVVVLTSACLNACNTSEATNDMDAGTGVTGNRATKSPALVIPEGTPLRVSLIDGLSTTRNSSGDTFAASCWIR